MAVMAGGAGSAFGRLARVRIQPGPTAPVEREVARATGAGTPIWGTSFTALVAFTVVLLTAPQNYMPIPGLAKMTAGLAILTHVCAPRRRRGPLWRRGAPFTWAVVLLAWAIATTPFSIWPGGAVDMLLNLYLKALAVFWLLGAVVDRLERLHRLLWTLALMSLPIALISLDNYFSGAFNALSAREAPRIDGYNGALTSNPNDLALMLNILLAITLGLAVSTTSRLCRMVLVLMAGLDVMTIVISFSRSGFLTLACTLGLSLMTFVPRRRRVGAVAVSVAAAVTLLMSFPSYQARLATIWNIEDDPTGSAQDRLQGNLGALTLISEQPIVGSGVGMDKVAMVSYGGTWHSVHNTLLQYAVDLGVPGAVLFLAVFGACLRCAIRARRLAGRSTSLEPLRRAAEGVMIGLVGFAVSALFAPVAYQFYFYYIGGLAVAVEHAASKSASAAIAAPPPAAGRPAWSGGHFSGGLATHVWNRRHRFAR